MPVSFSWKLDSVVDCYEPNDSPQQAHLIPIGAEIRPYMFAGFLSGEWPSYEAHRDFFEVTIDQPGLLRVTLQPGPISIALDLFDAQSPEQPLNGATSLDVPVIVESEARPGRYLLRFHPFVSPLFTPEPGQCAQCNPYIFSTELILADGSGKADQRCTSAGQGGTAGMGGQGGSAGAAGSGGKVTGCGWDPNQAFYECGFSGPDPSGELPIACPLGLSQDAPCGQVTGLGCCDDEGSVWYCSKDNILVQQPCATQGSGQSR